MYRFKCEKLGLIQIFKTMKTNEHNELLNQVKGLTWLPWVGSDYSDIKLLLIGESHYAQHENGDEDLDCYNYFLTDNNATISFVEDVIDGSTWSFFRKFDSN